MNTDKFTDQMISREASKLSFEIGALRINSRIANDFGLFQNANRPCELSENKNHELGENPVEYYRPTSSTEVRYSHHGLKLIARYQALSDQINVLIRSLKMEQR